MSKLRVLFICTGNTCRSPMAEGIFNQIKEEFPEIEAECASTGVSAVKGQRVTPWARQVCGEIGVDISQYRANYFTLEQMLEWDILAVMSQDQYLLLSDAGIPEEKMVLLDVEDPYGGTIDNYRQCRDRIAQRIRELFFSREKGEA